MTVFGSSALMIRLFWHGNLVPRLRTPNSEESKMNNRTMCCEAECIIADSIWLKIRLIMKKCINAP